ncbi:peroxisome biogenesis factor 20 [Neurospora tetraspora]|uniref:Peroxisome biogenesis factor 20 n=1 Tax=Neurospora tetraspora TaxID=94610 RepID=A0AAE0JCS5_9PEZI|nr:peroxisome biogenesis factor 20 [Neurospora tetraspora]
MSDSMCGPSNGAKNLLAHADRDRTLHQDRLVNSPNSAADASLRNRPSFAADGAFENFQQAPMLDAPGPSLGFAQNNLVLNNPGAPAFHAGQAPGVFGHAVGGAPATATPMHSSGAVAHGWVDQFSSMQLHQDTVHAASTMSPQARSAAMSTATHNPMMGLQDDHMAYNTHQFGGMGMGVGMGMGMSMDDPFVMHDTGLNNFTHQQPQFGLNDHVETALDVEAFNKAFGEYDESSFEQELAEWAEKEKAEKAQQAQQEFEAAEAEWMAQHGPTAENNTKVGPPTDEEMAIIDADLENLAQEQEAAKRLQEAEARRREGNEELAKAANAILTSVADNQSEKFQKSTFLDLMRRIGNREVEVDGDKLVDVATGEKVNTSPSDLGPTDDVSGPADANDKGKAPAEPASSA